MRYKKTAKAQDPEPDFRNLSTTLAVDVRLFTALHYRQSSRKDWEWSSGWSLSQAL